MIEKLRPKDSTTDLLFVGTDRFRYFTAQWNPHTGRLDVVQELDDVGEKHMRDSQSQDRCLVDPTGKFMAMHLWEGVLNVMRLYTRGSRRLELDRMDQVRLSELFIKASTFLYTETGHPKIAFLYQSRADARDTKLVIYQLTGDDRNTTSSRFDRFRDREFTLDVADDGCVLMIPVRKVEEERKRHNVRNPDGTRVLLGGLLLVTETKLLYIDEMTKATLESPLAESSIFVAWAEIDPRHYFLADDYGHLHVLTISTPEGVVVTQMEMVKFGKTSRASCLQYLGNSLLFVGSHHGDSQLFRFDLSRKRGNYLELVQTEPNIGPVLDFSIMDMGNRESDSNLGNEYSSGQARIVCGAGVHQDGSLRSVRSGVGLEDIGVLGDIEGTRGLFSLKSPSSDKHDTLVVSTVTGTRVFRFSDAGEVEEMESFSGLALEMPTLLTRNLPQERLVQVTASGATLLDGEGGIAIASWSAPRGRTITNVSANDQWLLLSTDGTSLISLDMANDLRVVGEKGFGETDQVACVHVSPTLEDIGVVGFWGSGTVSIIYLSTLQPIHGEGLRKTEDSTSVPRDLSLVQVLPPELGGPSLFVAMDDGNVVSFSVSEDHSMYGRRSITLGTRQARFHLVPKSEGIFSIFATTELPSLIYGAEGRIVYSAVTADEVEFVCPLNCNAFPDSVVVATGAEVKISQIDSERRTHVRPLPMGKMVRRVAYSPKEKVFALGCIQRDLVQGEEMVQSSVELVDEVIFDRVGKPFLLETVEYLELVEAVVRAELTDAYGNPAERFIVGTSFSPHLDTAISSPNRGRILVLGTDSERNPYLVMSHMLKGSCRCLAVLADGLIVAALTKTVIVSRYIETSNTSGQMIRQASYRPSTYPVDLAVHGNMIAVADLMKSMTLVEFVPGDTKGGDAQLVERARHYQSGWATAVCHVEDDNWLEADAEGNLVVLRRNPDGLTEENKQRLELVSEINMGEQVNQIRKINIQASPNAILLPRAFLGTVRSRACCSSG